MARHHLINEILELRNNPKPGITEDGVEFTAAARNIIPRLIEVIDILAEELNDEEFVQRSIEVVMEEPLDETV
jgi:hypothetical protein